MTTLQIDRPERKRLAGSVSGTSRARRVADRMARLIVSGGGALIILSVLGILAFIVIEVWPVLGGASVDSGRRIELSVPTVAAGQDEYRTLAAALGSDGILRIARTSDGEVIQTIPVHPGARRYYDEKGVR